MKRKNISTTFCATAELRERIRALLVIAQADPMSRYFSPTTSSIIREALHRGLSELEEEWGHQ
jgi:predicted DNA-binding protein